MQVKSPKCDIDLIPLSPIQSMAFVKLFPAYVYGDCQGVCSVSGSTLVNRPIGA